MNKAKKFLLLNYLVNKNINLCLKLIYGDEDLFRFLEGREMRKGLKYCSIKNNLMSDAILNKNETHIKKHLRISVQAFQKLCQLFPAKQHGYAVQIELGVVLFWLAAGTTYRVVSIAFNIPISTVFDIVNRAMDRILQLLPKIIVLPSSGEYDTIGVKFCNRAGSNIFEKAVGAIDGTHIKIKCPTDRHDEYLNRKLDYSIQLQAICDADHKYINICVGWPGSVHDQRVLRNSEVYLKQKYPSNDYYLLGDSGYKLTLEPIAIITPYAANRPLTQQQKKFNHLHSKARIAIEQSFGEMKTRWRCIFLRSLEINIKKCIKVIAVCCILHNICIDVGDLMNVDEEFKTENDSLIANGNHQPQPEASEFRNRLCSRL